MSEDTRMIRPRLHRLEGFRGGFNIVGPSYETIQHMDGTLFTCERHAGGRLDKCQINGKPVTPQEYVDRRNLWKHE